VLAAHERPDRLLEAFDQGSLYELSGFENRGDRALFVLTNPRFR
jgi:hypothetical protein